MRKVIAATVLALFGFAPALGSACEYEAATSASAAPPASIASVQPPAASKAPASTALKAPAPRTTAAKPAGEKNKEIKSDLKVVALTSN